MFKIYAIQSFIVLTLNNCNLCYLAFPFEKKKIPMKLRGGKYIHDDWEKLQTSRNEMVKL